jgi:uncharacterized Zn-finger protein
MSEETEDIDISDGEGPFEAALLGFVEKPCKDDIKRTSQQEDEGISSSSEQESSSEEGTRTAPAKKRARRTVKPKAKGRKQSAAAASAKSLNHECPHCQKKYETASKLELHVRSHTGETPFQCDLCDKRFAKKGHL